MKNSYPFSDHDIDQALLSEWRPIWAHRAASGDLFFVVPLLYHVALYVNPTIERGFDDRYCLSNLTLAQKAVLEFDQHGEIRYWQKWHNRNLSVIGRYAYTPINPPVPEYAEFEVQWDADTLRLEYPYPGMRTAPSEDSEEFRSGELTLPDTEAAQAESQEVANATV